MKTESELSGLLVDEGKASEGQLYEALRDLVQIGQTSGQVLFHDRFDRLNAEGKLLTTVLVAKAKYVIGLSKEDGLRPKDMEAITGLPGGTVRPKLSNLKSRHHLVIERAGKYLVPNAAISRSRKFLAEQLNIGTKN